MTSSATRGLLSGVGQALSVAGEMGLKDHYETLRMKKAQEYKLEAMEANNSYDVASEDKSMDHDVAMADIGHKNQTDLLDKRHENLADLQATRLESDGNESARNREFTASENQKSREATATENEANRNYKKSNPSEGSANRANKNKLQYLKRVQELEDAFSDPIDPISKEAFERGIAAARSNYGMNNGGNMAGGPSKEQVIGAFMKRNGIPDTDDGRAKAIQALSTSEKYGALFSAGLLQPSKSSAFNPLSDEKKAKAEEIRIRREAENAQLFRDQERRVQRKKEEDEKLALIQSYRNQQN